MCAYKVKDIKFVITFQFEKLGSKVMYKRIKEFYIEIIDYFFWIHRKPRASVSKEVYVWCIQHQDSSMAYKFISYLLNERNRENSEGER